MFWKEQSIHVIDFEGSPRYGVVEYGVVTLRSGAVADTRTALCAPAAEMTAKEIALHGIRPKDTLGAPPFDAHRELFFALRKSGLLAAHHASVENGFLKRQWPYPPFSPDLHTSSVLVQKLPQVAGWGPWIDTRALYAAIYPGLGSYALGDLVRAFALEAALGELAEKHCPSNRRKAHCALYDALASALLLLRLGDEEGFGGLTLQWLVTHSAASADARSERQQGELF